MCFSIPFGIFRLIMLTHVVGISALCQDAVRGVVQGRLDGSVGVMVCHRVQNQNKFWLEHCFCTITCFRRDRSGLASGESM